MTSTTPRRSGSEEEEEEEEEKGVEEEAFDKSKFAPSPKADATCDKTFSISALEEILYKKSPIAAPRENRASEEGGGGGKKIRGSVTVG